MNAGGNVLGQGNRANLTIGRALQLVVRNVGGGRPGREDRAAHGQPGKVGLAFAERLDETAPWEGLAQARGVPDGETGVTLMALEAPRVIVDQIAREPEGLCASLALALESVATPRLRLAFDAMLLVGPEHGRVFREAGWSRERVQAELFERVKTPAGELVRPILGVDKQLIEAARVFDVYQGPGVPEGQKSVAVEVTIQPREKTLTDAEIEALTGKIVAVAEKAVGAKLRT